MHGSVTASSLMVRSEHNVQCTCTRIDPLEREKNPLWLTTEWAWIEALCSALKEVYFRLTFRRSGASDELDCCGCFSASTCDRAALASLVVISPIPVSLADGKELELLKYLRRAMLILITSAACELECLHGD